MFSIVIVGWNAERYVRRCLHSLTNETRRDFAIYFVDNGSSDDSLAVARSYADRLAITATRLPENRGFAEGNNVGIELAMADEHPFVVTLNADVELAPDCMEKLAGAIVAYPDRDVFQILMINHYDRDVIDAAGIGFDQWSHSQQLGYRMPLSRLREFGPEIAGVCAGAAAYSKRALRSVRERTGYFDERFFIYYEDVDLALRLRRQGFRARLAADAIAYHVHSATMIEDSPRKTYYLVRNELLCLEKNLDRAVFMRILPRHFFGLIMQTLGHARRGRLRNVAAMLRGVRDYVRLAGSPSSQ
jgi:GT2 family glycosyltransferase